MVPATIAIKNGICHIGLSPEELEDLAKAGEEGRAKKCSTRDLPLIMATRNRKQDPATADLWGATTVASTMKLAHVAGISTFVTGGCGGGELVVVSRILGLDCGARKLTHVVLLLSASKWACEYGCIRRSYRTLKDASRGRLGRYQVDFGYRANA